MELLEEQNLIINHFSDKRYSNNSEICTHDNIKMPSVSLNRIEEIRIERLKSKKYFNI